MITFYHRKGALSIPDKKISPQAKYDKANTQRFGLKLNRNTDKDIISRLDEVPNKQGYVKSLIRNDITETKKK